MKKLMLILALTLTAHESISFADDSGLPPEEVVVIYQAGVEQTIVSTQFDKEFLRPNPLLPLQTVLDISVVCYSDGYWEVSISHVSGYQLEEYLKEVALDSVADDILTSAEESCASIWEDKYGEAYRKANKPTWWL